MHNRTCTIAHTRTRTRIRHSSGRTCIAGCVVAKHRFGRCPAGRAKRITTLNWMDQRLYVFFLLFRRSRSLHILCRSPTLMFLCRYEHFNASLWKQIERAPGFWEELAQFRVRLFLFFRSVDHYVVIFSRSGNFWFSSIRFHRGFRFSWSRSCPYYFCLPNRDGGIAFS
jgi:hypothetical protein